MISERDGLRKTNIFRTGRKCWNDHEKCELGYNVCRVSTIFYKHIADLFRGKVVFSG